MKKFAPEQWRQAFELLDTALDLPLAQREAWLEALEGTHPQLQPAMRELLARYSTDATGDFLKGLPARWILVSLLLR